MSGGWGRREGEGSEEGGGREEGERVRVGGVQEVAGGLCCCERCSNLRSRHFYIQYMPITYIYM